MSESFIPPESTTVAPRPGSLQATWDLCWDIVTNHYADFSGTADRRTFWTFWLAQLIIGYGSLIIFAPAGVVITRCVHPEARTRCPQAARDRPFGLVAVAVLYPVHRHHHRAHHAGSARQGRVMSAERILAGIGTLALIGGLAACGATSAPAAAPAPAVTVTATPTATASAPQEIINNNNNPPPVPAPIQTVVVPAPALGYAQPNPWSVAVAYTNDINSGDNWDAWNMLNSSVQGGWNGNYYTYVANFTPLSFEDMTYVSESGDSVTFTFYLHNVDTGWREPFNCTFTVDSGIITSSSSYQI